MMLVKSLSYYLLGELDEVGHILPLEEDGWLKLKKLYTREDAVEFEDEDERILHRYRRPWWLLPFVSYCKQTC